MRNRSKNKINITFIRHGATQSNLESRYLGWTDESLSLEGIKNLKDQWQIAPEVERVFASPMKRCIETAEIIFPDCKPVIIPLWKEINFGDFEGKNYKELSGNPAYQEWIDSNGTLPFPNGESREDFIDRTYEGFEECLRICKSEGLSEIACVVHGGTIMSIASKLTGDEYFSFQIKAGDEYKISFEIEEKE